jgi:hypothetical protein
MTDLLTAVESQQNAEKESAEKKRNKALADYWTGVVAQVERKPLTKAVIEKTRSAMKTLKLSSDDLKADIETLAELRRIRKEHDVDEAQAAVQDAGEAARQEMTAIAAAKVELERREREARNAVEMARHNQDRTRREAQRGDELRDGLRDRGLSEDAEPLVALPEPPPDAPKMPHRVIRNRYRDPDGGIHNVGDIVFHAGAPLPRNLEPVDLPHRVLVTAKFAGEVHDPMAIVLYGGPPRADMELLPEDEWAKWLKGTPEPAEPQPVPTTERRTPTRQVEQQTLAADDDDDADGLTWTEHGTLA